MDLWPEPVRLFPRVPPSVAMSSPNVIVWRRAACEAVVERSPLRVLSTWPRMFQRVGEPQPRRKAWAGCGARALAPQMRAPNPIQRL